VPEVVRAVADVSVSPDGVVTVVPLPETHT